MPVSFHNFDFSYTNAKGKPVFVPSAEGREIGLKVKKLVEEHYEFDPLYYHWNPGGHVAALHVHRSSRFFARIDLKNFFYTVSRRRVQRALRACGVKRHEFFAKWSTVRDPYEGHGYVLPYGFVQSPILASLVLAQSGLGAMLRRMSNEVAITVYLDDIAISSEDPRQLEHAFAAIVAEIEASGFIINAEKTAVPDKKLNIFNCNLATGSSVVAETRREEFYSVPRSLPSSDAFERYCDTVSEGNTAAVRG